MGILDRLKEIEEKGMDATQKEKDMVVAYYNEISTQLGEDDDE